MKRTASEEYSDRLEKIERVLSRVIPECADSDWVRRVAGGALPVNLPLFDRINAPARALVVRGGKRWRPLVMLLCAEMAGDGEAALPLTPIVELPHNGSLIIDDIEDGAQERRGEKAVHLEYGVDLAVNAGNHLYFLPTFLLETGSLPEARKTALYRIFLTYMRRLHLGQGLDILWHRTHASVPPEHEYLAMCRMKTGCLAAMGAELGTVAGGGSAELASLLGGLFEEVGVAFQILDDVKNLTTGNPGKRRGDDIVEGKKSLPVILHLSSRPEDTVRLAGLFRQAGSKGIEGAGSEIEEAISLLEASGSIAAASGRARQIVDGVLEKLERSCPDSEAKALLSGLLQLLLTPGDE